MLGKLGVEQKMLKITSMGETFHLEWLLVFETILKHKYYEERRNTSSIQEL